MSDQSQQKMSGADLKQHHEAIKREVLRVLDDVKLRQWAVEQATKCVPVENFEEIVKFIYNFSINAQENTDAKGA